MCIVQFPSRNPRDCILLLLNGSYATTDYWLHNCNGTSDELGYDTDKDINNKDHVYFRNATTQSEVNVSSYDFPNTLWYHLPKSEMIMKTSVFLPVIVFGVFGNFMMLHVIFKNKNLRTPFNMLIGNLAVADLASLFIGPVVFLTTDFFQNYVLDEVGCKMDGFIECSLLLAGVFNLSAISYDRLTAIVLPRETRLTANGSKIVIIVTWILGFLISLPLYFYRSYKERQWKNFLEKYCTEDTQILAIYWHILLAMLVWLPLFVMFICYSAIFIKLDRYENEVLKREHPLLVSYKTKAAKTMFIVVITFILCRMPFTTLIFLRAEMLKTNVRNQALQIQVLWFVSKYLIYVNAAINPLIYGLTNENFRRAFLATRAALCCSSSNKRKNKRLAKLQSLKGLKEIDDKIIWTVGDNKASTQKLCPKK